MCNIIEYMTRTEWPPRDRRPSVPTITPPTDTAVKLARNTFLKAKRKIELAHRTGDLIEPDVIQTALTKDSWLAENVSGWHGGYIIPRTLIVACDIFIQEMELRKSSHASSAIT